MVQSPYHHWVTSGLLDHHCKDAGKQGSSFLAASEDLRGDREGNARERPMQRVLFILGREIHLILDSSAMVACVVWVSLQTQVV